MCVGAKARNARAPKEDCYFNLTNSNTKIAHIPTVTGNCTTAASRIAPPRGSAKVSNIMAKAVSVPTTSLPFQFMRV